MTREELQAALADKSTAMVDVCIASIFVQSAKRGDYARLSFLLDRAIGKVPTANEMDEDLAAMKELKELSTDELLKIVRANLPEATKNVG